MTFTGVLGCGKFRTALKREPLDTQQRILAISERIDQGALKQAFNLLENTQADKALKARLYERISRKKEELAEESKQKAIQLYEEAGQTERAKYLSLI